MGRLARVKPHGTDSAGSRVMLNGNVQRIMAKMTGSGVPPYSTTSWPIAVAGTGVVANWYRDRAEAVRVVPRHCLQHHGRVLHRSRDWTGGVQQPGQRQNAGLAHATVSWLQADATA